MGIGCHPLILVNALNLVRTNWHSALIFAKSGPYIWKAPADVGLWNSIH